MRQQKIVLRFRNNFIFDHKVACDVGRQDEGAIHLFICKHYRLLERDGV